MSIDGPRRCDFLFFLLFIGKAVLAALNREHTEVGDSEETDSKQGIPLGGFLIFFSENLHLN